MTKEPPDVQLGPGASAAANNNMLQLIIKMSQLQMTRDSLNLDNELHEMVGRRM